MIPYGKQDIIEQDIKAVVAVLNSKFLTQGPCVPAFEEALATAVNAKNAVAVNSATSALHIACLALGVQQGDYVWTSPITFVASANVGRLCGAEVDFVDINLNTYNICPINLEKKLIEAEKVGQLPKVIIPVAMCGQSTDMASIKSLSIKYKFKIIEDASHAIGARYNGQFVGCGKYADVTVFSFHPVKIITTAEGGVAVTNDNKIADRMRLIRSHGVTRDIKMMNKTSEGPWYYQQLELGLNYRMTEMQAALGQSQLLRLGPYVKKRTELAKLYHEQLSDLPIELPTPVTGSESAWHLYVILLHDKLRRKEVFDTLLKKHVQVNVHYIPVHTQPYYQQLGFNEGDFPVSEDYYSRALSIPLFPAMTQKQQDYVVHSLKDALR